MSNKAVASAGIFRDIHVDANNIADIAIKMYRCGNNSGGITRVTVEKAKTFGFVMNGLFSVHGGDFGPYNCQDRGAAIGQDVFGFASEGPSFTIARCRWTSATRARRSLMSPAAARTRTAVGR
jgi:hypothetical protein